MKIAFLHNSAPSDFRVIGSHRFSDCHLRTWFSLLQFSRTCKTVPGSFQKASAVKKGRDKIELCCESSENYPISLLLSLLTVFERIIGRWQVNFYRRLITWYLVSESLRPNCFIQSEDSVSVFRREEFIWHSEMEIKFRKNAALDLEEFRSFRMSVCKK